jgi:hypothetical protein
LVSFCAGNDVLQALKGFLLTWNGRVCDYLHAFSKRHLPEMRLSGVAADLVVS